MQGRGPFVTAGQILLETGRRKNAASIRHATNIRSSEITLISTTVVVIVSTSRQDGGYFKFRFLAGYVTC